MAEQGTESEQRAASPEVVGRETVDGEGPLDLETVSPSAATRGVTEAGELADERQFSLLGIARRREDMRGRIAISLVAILAFVVLASFVTVWVSGGLTPAMKDLLTVILAPIVTLVGSATGFYFGGRVDGDDKTSS